MTAAKYESDVIMLSHLLKDKVQRLAKRHKVQHDTIWQDLDVLLSDEEAFLAMKRQEGSIA